MRHFFLLMALVVALGTLGGCKTAEFAVQHPVTGLHVVAKFESQEPDPLPAADDCSHHHTH